MPLWKPQPEWQGQDAFLIGGGASLKGFDFKALAGRHVIGINDAFRLGPEIVEICFFGDSGFFHRQKWDLEKFPNRSFTCADTLFHYNLPWCQFVKKAEAGVHDGATIGWNYSSGAAAINLAKNLGAQRIFLLGYDMGTVNSRSHWHGREQKTTPQEVFDRFDIGFKQLWTGLQPLTSEGLIAILNVTDGSSKLNYFDRISFPEMERMMNESH